VAGGDERLAEADAERVRARDGRAVHALRVPELRRPACDSLVASGTPHGAGSVVDVDLAKVREMIHRFSVRVDRVVTDGVTVHRSSPFC
jgi:hypothetical protein